MAAAAGSDHHIWLVWQPGYQTYGVKCETIAADLIDATTKHGGGARNCRHQPPRALLRADEPDRVRRRRDPEASARSRARPVSRDRRRPPLRGRAAVRRLWGRLPESLREALLPFVVARVVVLGRARPGPLRRRPHPPGGGRRGGPGAPGAARLGRRLVRDIARWATRPLGRQSLRFFPLVPAADPRAGLGPRARRRPGAGPAGQRRRPGGHGAALRAGAPGDRRARRVARRAVWLLSLAARRLRAGHGLRRVASCSCFADRLLPGAPAGRRTRPGPAALRRWPAALAFAGGPDPAGRRAARAGRRPSSWCAGGPGWAAAERLAGVGRRRWRPSSASWSSSAWAAARGRRLLGAAAGPAPELATTAGSPIRSSPSSHDARGVLHHHVGTALHVPWVLLAAGHAGRLLAPAARPPTALFAAGVAGRRGGRVQSRLVRALRARAPSPCPWRPPWSSTEPQLERTVLALLAAGLAGYALLAFLNISVP